MGRPSWVEPALRVIAVALPLSIAAVGFFQAREPNDSVRADLERHRLPKELDVEAIALDIEAIRRVEAVLGAVDPHATAKRLLHLDAHAFASEGLSAGSGRALGPHVDCRVDFAQSDGGRAVLHSATCASRYGWKLALPHYLRYTRRLRPSGGQLEAGNVAGRPDVTGDRARADILGPVPWVHVPPALVVDYELLTARDDSLGFGAMHGCGPGQFSAERLLRANRVDLLRAAMRGPNPAGRLYAALTLLENVPLTPADLRVIDVLPQVAPKVRSCGGCVTSLVDVEKTLRSARRTRSAAADLGLLLPAGRRVVVPGKTEAQFEETTVEPDPDPMTSALRTVLFGGPLVREE